VEQDGEGLFRLACEEDLEGMVAKRKSDPYLEDHTSWLKIRNRDYSQWVGREELFEQERVVILMRGGGMSVWRRVWTQYSWYTRKELCWTQPFNRRSGYTALLRPRQPRSESCSSPPRT